MPGRKYQASATSNYRYSINGQEKSDELNENLTTALYWEYDSRIGRRWNVDPLTSKFAHQSPYCAFDNSPINKMDPDGRAAKKTNSPIYGTDGKFLGTDDEGLKGKAIVMKESDFKQGMKHEVAAKKDLAPKGGKDFLKAIPYYTNYNDFYIHYNSLPSRPDYDGIVTDTEARQWWQTGNSQTLYVNQSLLDLTPVTTKDFKNNTNITHNFFFDASSNTDVGRVYGTLTLHLLNANSGEIKVGAINNAFLDRYDFNGDGRLLRDAATWGARGIVGEGTGFNILGYGNNPKIPVKK